MLPNSQRHGERKGRIHQDSVEDSRVEEKHVDRHRDESMDTCRNRWTHICTWHTTRAK